MPIRLTIQDCIEAAKTKGGTCLSPNYVNSNTKLKWQCAQGHTWDAKVSDIKSGYWCPTCAGVAKPTMEDIHRIARDHEGECLSTEYVNNRQKLLWRCKEGHQFEMTYKAVGRGYWCTNCSGKYNVFTKDDLDKIAVSRGGAFLSEPKDYLISETAMWSCQNGHQWRAKIANVVSNKSWCKVCKNNLGEQTSRFIFEQMTGHKFPQKRPKWLRGPDQKKSMELDGYCEELNIAFEHQGRQHYEDGVSKYHTKEVLERDTLKRELCIKKGVKVLEIPQIGHYISIDEAIKLIGDFLVLNNCPVIRTVTPKEIDDSLYRVYDPKLDKLKSIAQSRGGECLSKSYLGIRSLMHFRCANSHEWYARPNDVTRGSWCSICSGAGGKKKTIEDLKSMFREGGIECLSDTYGSSKDKYKWRCKAGHILECRYDTIIKAGGTCYACNNLAKNKK